jgi:hypothetical protein
MSIADALKFHPNNLYQGKGGHGGELPPKEHREFSLLTAREYAAIHLKVPESGTVWLDEMIRKSNSST